MDQPGKDLIRLGVDAGRCFIQDEHLLSLEKRPCQDDKLFLSRGKACGSVRLDKWG